METLCPAEPPRDGRWNRHPGLEQGDEGWGWVAISGARMLGEPVTALLVALGEAHDIGVR